MGKIFVCSQEFYLYFSEPVMCIIQGNMNSSYRIFKFCFTLCPWVPGFPVWKTKYRRGYIKSLLSWIWVKNISINLEILCLKCMFFHSCVLSYTRKVVFFLNFLFTFSCLHLLKRSWNSDKSCCLFSC